MTRPGRTEARGKLPRLSSRPLTRPWPQAEQVGPPLAEAPVGGVLGVDDEALVGGNGEDPVTCPCRHTARRREPSRCGVATVGTCRLIICWPAAGQPAQPVLACSFPVPWNYPPPLGA